MTRSRRTGCEPLPSTVPGQNSGHENCTMPAQDGRNFLEISCCGPYVAALFTAKRRRLRTPPVIPEGSQRHGFLGLEFELRVATYQRCSARTADRSATVRHFSASKGALV